MLISRRAAIARGATVLAGLLWVGSADAAPAEVTYRLKTWKGCSCKACHNHAANRLFGSRDAADRGRAHRGCKCLVVRDNAIDARQWQALFGPRRKPRLTADRRWAWTRRALTGNGRSAPSKPVLKRVTGPSAPTKLILKR